MERALHIFNPDHDLALAHGTNHYVSPASALEFARDCAALPLWFSQKASVLMPTTHLPENFLHIFQKCGLPISLITDTQMADCQWKIFPWGWNYNLYQQLLKMGVPAQNLPAAEALNDIRLLSHRRLTIAAMDFLRDSLPMTMELPPSSIELTDIEDVEEFVRQQGVVVLKMPWSGSGRGLRKIVGEMSTHQRGWALQSIRKYGCVLGELYHSVVQDFAMEFGCGAGVEFYGYSLFSTHNGVYQENHLLSDVAIEAELAKYVGRDALHACRQRLTAFLQQNVAPVYDGPVGVDMFVYQKDNAYFINPVVELNIRMTMGLASNIFFKKFAPADGDGRWRIRYLSEPGALQREDAELSARHPLEIVDGKVVRGYLSLTPIFPETRYAVQVCMNSQYFE